MTEKNQTKSIKGHEYDGIKELDNQLPNWWLIIFLVSMMWGAGYWIFYTLGGGPNQLDEYKAEMADIKNLRAVPAKELPVEKKGSGLESKKDIIGLGQSIFSKNCASCHGKSGEGSIGPNLADNFWIHGEGDIKSIAILIKKGSIQKGMPPWGNMLSKEKINAVASFIHSLKDSKPKNPKKAEGREIPLK